MHLASSSKRIDICSAQFAHIFHLSKHPSIEGKTCLEIGAGWVLTHALVCYLLGAKKIIATDIVPYAFPDVIPLALKDSIASIPRDILAPFSDHSHIRERFNRLLSISKFSFDTLKEFGIEYQSPIDFSTEKVSLSFDFIYSNSVLEHIYIDDIPVLLNNLIEILNKGGAMIHCIHLEDHKDTNRDPFDFLTIPGDQYTRKLQSERGNRIRCSEWRRIFGGLEGTTTDFIYSYARLDKALPKSIDRSISYDDEHDLRTSHIGVYTRKEE
jgi:cyclopropane fatty-acyl-phospholipid synthase-like methyltransferase